MPGYNIERFVDISEKERDAMQCSICQDILQDPVVAPCCLQMFCKLCIREWLKTNSTCPYDRKSLATTTLTQPPKALANMLLSLKITCDFKDIGCNEVIILEQLSKHVATCIYNICDICNCQKLSDHNCVKSLLKLNLKVTQENIDLKCKLEDNAKIINELNFKNASIEKQQITEASLFESAREHINDTHTIISKNLDTEITKYIIEMIKEEILNKKTLAKLCQALQLRLSKKFGKYWQAIAGHQGKLYSYFVYENGDYIRFKFGLLAIHLYATQCFNYKLFMERYKSGGIARELDVIQATINEAMKLDVKDFIFKAIDKSTNLPSILSEFKSLMENKYPKYYWQIIGQSNDGAFSITTLNEYIYFKISNIQVVLYGQDK